MRGVFRIISIAVVASLSCAAADREILELQRQMALLDERVGTLQRSLDEKIGGVMAILERTLDKVTEGQTKSAVFEHTLEQRLARQAEGAAPAMANLNAQLDRMFSEFAAISENIAAVGRRLNRLEQKLVDLDGAIRTFHEFPLPPPAPETGSAAGPGLGAEDLYQSAVKDQLAGRDDLALREFSDYRKHFGDTGLAAEAQLRIGEIHYYKGDHDAALETFELFLNQYPSHARAPDALYLKARVLEKQGMQASAAETLKRLVRLYPNSDPAQLARAELDRDLAGRGPPEE